MRIIRDDVTLANSNPRLLVSRLVSILISIYIANLKGRYSMVLSYLGGFCRCCLHGKAVQLSNRTLDTHNSRLIEEAMLNLLGKKVLDSEKAP